VTAIHNQHLIKEWFGITLDKKYSDPIFIKYLES